MGEQREIGFRALEGLSGTTLAGRFVLDRMVGYGGYGAVFLAEQRSMGRRCAVKVLVPHVLDKPQNVQRFELEARATSRLEHPNTVVIYDFGVDESRKLLFLAMEYIEGQSLRERIREGVLDVETAVWITHQAAGSLQDAHDKGLVHRDVKPHNIMLTERGGDPTFVKVIDFGIARFLEDEELRKTLQRVTRTGVIIGTPAYMSPEQIRNRAIDGRSDQYALAITVFQMLTGRKVFRGENAVDIATQQLTKRPPLLSQLRPELGTDLDAVLARALSKRPEARFATIREFSDALAEAAGIALPGTIDSAERRRQNEEPPTITLSMTPTIDEGVAATTESINLDSDHTTAPIDRISTVEAAPVPPNGDAEPERVEDVQRGVEDAEDVEVAEAGKRADRVEMLRVVAAPEQRSARRWWLVAAGVLTLLLVSLAWSGTRPATQPVAQLATQPIVSEKARAGSTDRAQEIAPGQPAPVVAEFEPDVGAGASATATVIDMGHASGSVEAAPLANSPKSRVKVRPKKPPKAAVGKATVTVMPWGKVYVDGQYRGDRTRQVLQLKEGRHTVELRQDDVSVLSKTVDVQPGKNTMVELIAP